MTRTANLVKVARRSANLLLLLVFLACLKKEAPQPYNIAFVSINNRTGGGSAIGGELQKTVSQINNTPHYQAKLFEYRSNWDVGLRYLLARASYQLILPINVSQNSSSPQEVSEILYLARRYPEQNFAVPLDFYNNFANPPANLFHYVIFMHEAAFLSGVIAATLSEQKRFGIMVEENSTYTDIYSAGFIQGIRATVDESYIKLVRLSKTFTVSQGKSTATLLLQEGIDVIFEESNHSLASILQAAVERNGFVITHKQYQQENQQRVMVQLVPRISLSINRLVEAARTGDRRQRSFYGGLANGDADISWAPDPDLNFVAELSPQARSKIPALKRALQEWREKIISGEYQVHNVLVNGRPGKELQADAQLNFATE